MQVGFEEIIAGFIVEEFSFSECNVMGTMVNFDFSIRKAPPLIDTSIVPGGADRLNALFEYGLTINPINLKEGKLFNEFLDYITFFSFSLTKLYLLI